MSTQNVQATESSDEDAQTKLLEHGKELYSEGRMQESAAIFNQLIGLGVHVGEASYGLGLISLAAGDVNGASAHLTRALQQNPRDTNALYVFGTIAERYSVWDYARMYYTQALAIDPHLEGASARLAQLPEIQTSVASTVGASTTARTAQRRGLWVGAVIYLIFTGIVIVAFSVGLNSMANASQDFPGQTSTSTTMLSIFAVFFALIWLTIGFNVVRPLIRSIATTRSPSNTLPAPVQPSPSEAQPTALGQLPPPLSAALIPPAKGPHVSPGRPTQPSPSQGLATADLGYALRLGLGLGITMAVVIGGVGLWFSHNFAPNYFLSLLDLAAVLVLPILAGLLPARRNGSMGSASLAGGIVALAMVVSIALPTSNQILAGLVDGAVVFTLSVVSGLVGRWQYRRNLGVRDRAGRDTNS